MFGDASKTNVMPWLHPNSQTLLSWTLFLLEYIDIDQNISQYSMFDKVDIETQGSNSSLDLISNGL